MSEKAKLGTIEEVLIPLEVVLGDTSISLKQFSTLAEGSIIELNSICGEPVTLRASEKVIAQGEVVVIDENFGIRITELLDKRS